MKSDCILRQFCLPIMFGEEMVACATNEYLMKIKYNRTIHSKTWTCVCRSNIKYNSDVENYIRNVDHLDPKDNPIRNAY